MQGTTKDQPPYNQREPTKRLYFLIKDRWVYSPHQNRPLWFLFYWVIGNKQEQKKKNILLYLRLYQMEAKKIVWTPFLDLWHSCFFWINPTPKVFSVISNFLLWNLLSETWCLYWEGIIHNQVSVLTDAQRFKFQILSKTDSPYLSNMTPIQDVHHLKLCMSTSF